MAEQVVFVEIVGDLPDACSLASNGGDHPITLPSGDAVIAAHLGEAMIDADRPVAVAILDQAAVSAVSIRSFQMGQIFKTHPVRRRIGAHPSKGEKSLAAGRFHGSDRLGAALPVDR